MRTVLLRTIRSRSEQLKVMEFADQLVGGTPSRGMSELVGVNVDVGTCLRMRSGLTLARNDLIFVGRDRDVCCVVKACFKGNGGSNSVNCNSAEGNRAFDNVGILVEQLAFQEQVGDDCSKWRRLFKGDDLMAT